MLKWNPSEEARKQEIPLSFKEDYYCNRCGEAWDKWAVREALQGRIGDMTKSEATRFMKGKGCPSCPKRGEHGT